MALWGILALALALRLINIDSSLIGLNSWRQADNAAMARNFVEGGFALFHPQIDWGGNTPGYVESEFPLMPFLAGLLSRMCGEPIVWGRLLSLGASLAAIIALFSFVRRLLGARAAGWAALMYAVLPFSVFYGRAFMVESAMLACIIAGLLWFDSWLESGRIRWWWLSAAAIVVASLLKVVALYVSLPLYFSPGTRRAAKSGSGPRCGVTWPWS